MTQTDFQRRAFTIVQVAHSAADRADARILMRMVELVDEGDYPGLVQMAKALQARYREQLGAIPAADDARAGGDGPASDGPGQ